MQRFYLFRFLAIVFVTIFFGLNASAQAPAITTVSPASGSVGTAITLTGNGFNSTAANNVVFFGSTVATVTSASATSLTVTVPVGASYQRISVTDITTSLTGYSANPFVVTYNKGTVTYASHIDILAGNGPWNIAIGDLDGDGKPDVVVTNLTAGTISIYRNQSSTNAITTSTFAAKVDLTTGTSPQSVAIADIDGDGKQDIIVSNSGSATVSVFRNISTSGSITIGSFATKADFATGTTPYTVAVGDIDGDGKPDLVTANSGSTTVSILRNTSTSSTISFAGKVDLTTGTTPRGIGLADFDGDGKLDIAVSNNGAATVSVFKNSATAGSITAANFAARVNFTVGASPNCVAVGDLDGDGKPDIAVSNYGSTSVSLLLNTTAAGTINFATKFDLTTASSTRYVALADLDGDGKIDVVADNDVSGSVSIFKNKSTTGTLSFNTKTDYNTLGTPEGVALGDLNGDGTMDIAVADNTGTAFSIIRNLPGNNDLSSIALSSGTLTPTFTGSTTTYTANVSNTTSTITVTPTLSDANATAKVNGTAVTSGSASGNIALTVGANTITIVVTAQDASTNTYTLTVTRLFPASTNANLSSIALSDGTLSPIFASATTSYTASVPNATSNITITPTTADAGATVKVNGTLVTSGSASAAIALNVGSNTITTVVTAEDGSTTNTYTITVTRAKSSNANLSGLTLSSGTLSPAFAQATTNYTATVGSTTSSITITPTLADATATLKVNGTAVTSGSASGSITLSPGSNTITILVTAQDGTTNTYTIIVTRTQADVNLVNLTISSGTLSPAFAATTTAYTASVINTVSSITLTPTASDVSITIKVNGTVVTSGTASGSLALAVGANTITVLITALDGSTNTYTITVIRASANGAGQTQVITFPAFTAATYGSADVAIGASSSNSTIPITYTSSNTAVVTIVNNAVHIVAAGNATITASQAGNATYLAATPVAQSITINKAQLTATANNQTKVFGAANPGLTATYTGFVNSENSAVLTQQATLVTTANTASGVGSYTITPSGASAANYNFAYVNGALSVTPAILTVTAANQSKAYGAANPTLTVVYLGFVGTDNASSLTTAPTVTTTATATSPVNTYLITASGGAATNYTFSYVAGVLTINKAPLTITATNQTRMYGTADPVFTGTYTGFVGTDGTSNLSVLPTFTPSATITSTPGNYAITPSGAVAANYNISYVAGVLTITASTNTNLTNLKVSAGTLSPAFNPGIITYTDSVGLTVDHVDINVITVDPTAAVTVNGVPGNNGGGTSSTVTLSPGFNPIKIKVTAQDASTEKTYSVLIYRAMPAIATGSSSTAAATNTLTPNGDGKNDVWVVKDILSYPNNQVTVFDRGGRVVYSQHAYTNTWDGTLRGNPLSEGTYYYTIDLGNNTPIIKGFITIFRNR